MLGVSDTKNRLKCALFAVCNAMDDAVGRLPAPRPSPDRDEGVAVLATRLGRATVFEVHSLALESLLISTRHVFASFKLRLAVTPEVTEVNKTATRSVGAIDYPPPFRPMPDSHRPF